MPESIFCPKCHKEYLAKAGTFGKKVKCGECGHKFMASRSVGFKTNPLDSSLTLAFCQHCGSESRPGKTLCPACGKEAVNPAFHTKKWWKFW